MDPGTGNELRTAALSFTIDKPCFKKFPARTIHALKLWSHHDSFESFAIDEATWATIDVLIALRTRNV